MAQVEQLLNYQQQDSLLLKIEQEVANSKERKNFLQAKNYIEKTPEKLDALDAKARETADLLEALNKRYIEIAETLEDFDSLDDLIDGGADISFYKKNVMQITEQLKSIKTEINSLTKSIKDADEEYKTLKKEYKSVYEKATGYQTAYKQLKAEKAEEMSAVKRELEKLEKNIDPEVMKRYQIKRSERIFPIICAAVPEGKEGFRCSKCGNSLSIVGKEKILSGGVTECDNCHRFIYKD